MSDTKTTPSPSALPEEVEFEFSDLVKLACMLCARQFKTLDQLKKHNQESDLHKVFLFRHHILYGKILTLRSAISKTRTYGMWQGGRSKPLKLLLKRAVPQLPHRNIVIGLQNDVSCTTNLTSHYPKALRISASNGVRRRDRPGPQHPRHHQ